MSKTFTWCQDKTRLATWNKQVFCVNRYGNKWWYLNGQPHRENGPACEYASGGKEWWLNDKEYSESGYWKELDE